MNDDSRQQRDTKQRRMIYETVMSRRDHPNADDIYLDVHTRVAKVSKGTVYRNLKLLADNGDITRVVVSGADRYDSTLSLHYHIICTECGKVVDAPLEYIHGNDAYVEKKTGFTVKRHRTVFEGICPECREKVGKKGVKIRLNEDEEVVRLIKKGLEETGGYCPCRADRSPDTKCMCKEFREQIKDADFEGYCHCMLYYKER